LEAMHPPLACLSKQCMHIADAKQIVVYITVKAPRRPLRHGTNEHAISIPGLGESLINIYLVIPNPSLHLILKLCC
jgi:hypothetical protein